MRNELILEEKTWSDKKNLETVCKVAREAEEGRKKVVQVYFSK